MPTRDTALEKLARSQLFALDLRPENAPQAIAAELGGPDAATPVVWNDADSALMVFPAETRVRLAKGFVFIELAVATDQTGRDTVLLPFRIGAAPNEAVASAVSEPHPRGNPVIAARWGSVMVPAVWHAVLRAGNTLLAGSKVDRPLVVSGVYTPGQVLSYVVTAPVDASEIREYLTSAIHSDVLPDLSVLNRRHLGSLPLQRSKATPRR